jgi:ABC-2 type transport system ATP-binding protein
MIEIQSVSKSFGDKLAVNNLCLNLEPGTITGFIGPNGAGKTTTIRMLCGILKPDSGKIIINGYDIAKNPIEAKNEFGFISDNPDLFLPLKGIEYIKFICNMYNVDPTLRTSRMEELLAEFEMEDAVSQKIETYSHGMRQKIHIIAALMHNPNVWIMDEPMTGLDPQSSYLLKRRMKLHASEGNIVLFSTHVLEVAEKLCNKIAIINKGKLNYTGTLEALREKFPQQTLEEIFLHVTGSKAIEDGRA